MLTRHSSIWPIAIALFAGGGAHANNSKCYDVGRGQPAGLEGRLLTITFPGPPNYEDVQKGDTPEPTYVVAPGAQDEAVGLELHHAFGRAV